MEMFYNYAGQYGNTSCVLLFGMYLKYDWYN